MQFFYYLHSDINLHDLNGCGGENVMIFLKFRKKSILNI